MGDFACAMVILVQDFPSFRGGWTTPSGSPAPEGGESSSGCGKIQMFLLKPLHRTHEGRSITCLKSSAECFFLNPQAQVEFMVVLLLHKEDILAYVCIYDVYLSVSIYLQHQQFFFFTLGEKHNQFATLSCSPNHWCQRGQIAYQS